MKKMQKILISLLTIISSHTSCSMPQSIEIKSAQSPTNTLNTTAINSSTSSKNVQLNQHVNFDENAEIFPHLNTDDKKTNTPFIHDNHDSVNTNKNEILQKLQEINSHDSTTNSLLNTAGMDQLFNNFIYFKEFIVHNFTKEKMISLSIEFINQIYPKEHTPVINMKSTQAALPQLPDTRTESVDNSTVPTETSESTPLDNQESFDAASQSPEYQNTIKTSIASDDQTENAYDNQANNDTSIISEEQTTTDIPAISDDQAATDTSATM